MRKKEVLEYKCMTSNQNSRYTNVWFLDLETRKEILWVSTSSKNSFFRTLPDLKFGSKVLLTYKQKNDNEISHVLGLEKIN